MRSFSFYIALFFVFSSFPATTEAKSRHQLHSQNPSLIYEIYPRSFQDSNGDGTGDLGGVISRLDYIQDLGADTIWLMPIFESPSIHGYDVTNYEKLNSAYGDSKILSELIKDVHSRGMKILLDLPVNSTSDQHPWFLDSQSGLASASRALYIWSPTPLNWSSLPIVPGQTPLDDWHLIGVEYYLSSFGASLPDLNWKNEEVYIRIRDVFLHWVRQGIDGFRLDAAKHLVKGPDGEQNQPGTHRLWQRIAGESRKIAPSTYFIGEVWDSSQNIAGYYGLGRKAGRELNATFDFPRMFALRTSLKDRSAQPLVNSLVERLNEMPTQTFAAPFIGNHDRVRIASEVGGDVERLKLAALFELTLPGTPVIYYGDEIGLKNGTNADHQGDLAKRTPMQWTSFGNMGFTSDVASPWISFSDSTTDAESERADPKSVLNTYRNLIFLRKSVSALNSGDLLDPKANSPGALSYWRRNLDGTAVCVIINMAPSSAEDLVVQIPPSVVTHYPTHVLYGDASTKIVRSSTQITLSLPGTSAIILGF